MGKSFTSQATVGLWLLWGGSVTLGEAALFRKEPLSKGLKAVS